MQIFTEADDFLISDIRMRENVTKALSDFEGEKFEKIYKFAAGMGGAALILLGK
jgi:hypothetical protein